jgi:hypothetical protein
MPGFKRTNKKTPRNGLVIKPIIPLTCQISELFNGSKDRIIGSSRGKKRSARGSKMKGSQFTKENV